MGYYIRVQYKGKRHGYWQDIEEFVDEDERSRLLKTAELCKQRGAIPSDDPEVVSYVESLCQSDLCPPAFHGVGDDDEIQTVYVEIRTFSYVAALEGKEE